MPLTDSACRNAKCTEGKPRVRLTDEKGLYLEVLPAGGKYWRLKYRFACKEKRLGLGVYPSFGGNGAGRPTGAPFSSFGGFKRLKSPTDRGAYEIGTSTKIPNAQTQITVQ